MKPVLYSNKSVRFYLRRLGKMKRALAVKPECRSLRQQNDVEYGKWAESWLRTYNKLPKETK